MDWFSFGYSDIVAYWTNINGATSSTNNRMDISYRCRDSTWVCLRRASAVVGDSNIVLRLHMVVSKGNGGFALNLPAGTVSDRMANIVCS